MTLAELPEFVRTEMMRNPNTQKWGFGWPHELRLRKSLDRLLACCELDEQMIKMLKVSIWMHDIRRDKLSGHEKAAAEYFKTLEIEGLSREETEMICYAIQNHGRGPERMISGEPMQRREELLRWLILLDRMDSMYLKSMCKTIQYQLIVEKRMDALSGFSAARLRRLLEKGEYVVLVDEKYLREESYLGRMLSDYLTVKALVDLMRPRLGEKFIEAINEKETRSIIEWMIDLQEENERSFTEPVSF